MVKSINGGKMDTRQKQLVNLPEEHRNWIRQVVDLARQNGQDTNQTEILRFIIGRAMVEDPESFIQRLAKLKSEAKLKDVERRFAAIQAERTKLLEELEKEHGVSQQSR